jgi:hypothetical protein
MKTHTSYKRILIQSSNSSALFSVLWKKERHGHFIQDGATAHTDNYSTNVLNVVSEKRLSCRSWPARSPNLNLCDFNLWGNINDIVYSRNHHILDELTQNTCETIQF